MYNVKCMIAKGRTITVKTMSSCGRSHSVSWRVYAGSLSWMPQVFDKIRPFWWEDQCVRILLWLINLGWCLKHNLISETTVCHTNIIHTPSCCIPKKKKWGSKKKRENRGNKGVLTWCASPHRAQYREGRRITVFLIDNLVCIRWLDTHFWD